MSTDNPRPLLTPALFVFDEGPYSMLFLRKSEDRIAIKCTCGMFSLVFKDRGVRFQRPIKCLSCGSTEAYGDLLDGYEKEESGAPHSMVEQAVTAPAF